MSDLISRQAAIDHWRLIIDASNTDSRYNMGFVDGLEFCINHLSTMPSAQPSPIWHQTFEDDPDSFPDDDRTVLVSFSNFSLPMLGQWRRDPDEGGAWYMGDMDETFIENDLYVDGWWELPEKPEVKE